MQPYTYRKLNEAKNEIRIIELQPGTPNDVIEVVMHYASVVEEEKKSQEAISLKELQTSMPPGWVARKTFEGRFIFETDDRESEVSSWVHPDPHFDSSRLLSAQPQAQTGVYEALSYVWGPSEDDPASVIVRESNALFSIRIRQNLLSALRHLRKVHEPRSLWIDAICINQNDDEERGRQVQLMARIYKFARRVVVWLGNETTDSATALSTLKYLGEQIEFTIDDCILRAPGCPNRDWHHTWVNLPYDGKTWHSIENLLQRPWFARLWVRQEIQLANQHSIVQCGHLQIPWYRLRRALLCLSHKQHIPRPRLANHAKSLHTWTRNFSGCDAVEVLTALQDAKCSDPRDMIYGLLGILPPSFATKIRPDYSLSVGEVYKDVFLTYLNHTQRLDLLPFTSWSKTRADTPSWVPGCYFSSATIRGAALLACGVSRAYTERIDGDVLKVLGLECGTVRTVSEPAPRDTDQVLPFIQNWEPKNLRSALYVTGESLEDAYALTLCIHRTPERVPWLPVPPLQEWKSWLQSVQGPTDTFRRTALNEIATRRFITLENGYIGLGPPEAQPGDRLSVMLGCQIPILLRPQSSGKLAVVGSCYIHGLMNCEAFLGRIPAPWRVQVGRKGESVNYRQLFFNPTSGDLTLEDPRLDPLTEGWERAEFDKARDDTRLVQYFRNGITGEIINSDPRLSPQALTARGVKLQWLHLI